MIQLLQESSRSPFDFISIVLGGNLVAIELVMIDLQTAIPERLFSSLQCIYG